MGFLDTVKSKAGELKSTVDKKMAGAHLEHTAWGQLVKAKLEIFDLYEKSAKIEEFPFRFNPTTLKVTRSATFEEVPTTATGKDVRWKNTAPTKVEFGDLWFDTYEERANVRDKYIRPLEALLEYNATSHHVPSVRFVWGDYTYDTTKYYVNGLTVEYTMFLPTGMPVRAKATLQLTEVNPIKDQQKKESKESPDHAKIYTVRRGDTLQSIALAEYEDPREWRRIASSNGIDDPMSVKPGTKLLVPPILK